MSSMTKTILVAGIAVVAARQFSPLAQGTLVGAFPGQAAQILSEPASMALDVGLGVLAALAVAHFIK